MLDGPSYEDCYKIRVKHDSSGRYTIAYNEMDDNESYLVLVTDFDKVWSVESLDGIPTEDDLERAARKPRPYFMPLIATLAVRACASSTYKHMWKTNEYL